MICAVPDTYRVIVIEEQGLIRKALCEIISRDVGFEIAGDFKSVTAAAGAHGDPEVVLLDIDGIAGDACDAIRACAAMGAATHVCALTSFARAEVMQRCLHAGALGFVLKDALPAEFLRAVRIVAGGVSYVDPRVAVDSLGLSPREMEIVCLIARGCSNREIGTQLVLSEKTIKNYISHIFAKLGIVARTQAAAYAFRTGMV